MTTLTTYAFELPTRIEFGEGVIATVGQEVKKIGAKRVLIVADKGVINAGLTQGVEKSLSEAGIPYLIFDKIVPNPRDTDCHLGYEIAKEEKIDALIAVGGGSSMDTAKAMEPY